MNKIFTIIGFVLFAVLPATANTTSTGNDTSLSNKWRIEVSEGAKSTGTMVFRITPKEQPAVEVRVDIEGGTRENKVAVRIRDAFRAQLPKKAFHIERDDGEDVLVKKRHKAPRFALSLVSSNVKAVRIHIEKE
ncbi:MAG: hypothetical protein L3J24_06770 [Xanthomonadales bacterium]|nr:hypothetical protein [Xanthomonadales bacterium]